MSHTTTTEEAGGDWSCSYNRDWRTLTLPPTRNDIIGSPDVPAINGAEP